MGGNAAVVVAGLHFLGLLALAIGIAALLGFKAEGVRAIDILGTGFAGMVVGEGLFIGIMVVVDWLLTSALRHVISETATWTRDHR